MSEMNWFAWMMVALAVVAGAVVVATFVELWRWNRDVDLRIERYRNSYRQKGK